MRLGEGLAQGLRIGVLRLLHHQLEGLPAVAKLVAHAQACGAPAERGLCLADHRLALAHEALPRQRLSGQHDRARDIAARRSRGQAERAQHARGARAQDALDAQLAGHRRRVQRAGAPERHQHERARVDPPLDRQQTQCAQHLGLGDAHDAFGARRRIDLQLAREAADGERCGPAVEHQASSQRRVLEQPAQQQVGVGDGGSLTAAAVAGGSRDRARGSRPDPERTARVGPRDRAAARTDRVDVEHRQCDRPVRDPSGATFADGAVVDHAHVAGGAAHVEAQHVGLARQLRQQQRPADAARRPREHRQGGMRARARGLREPARGLHDLGLGQSARARLARQPAKVGLEQRRERRVKDGGGRAFELSEGANEIGGQRAVSIG